MANKKSEIEKKKRTMYFEKKLFEEFSSLAKENGKSASQIFNNYMRRVVSDYKSKLNTAN